MNYYSPELVRYIQESARPDELTEASDIFALGLIYVEYLTGRPPKFDPRHHEAATAVLNGQTLRLESPRVPAPVAALIDTMLLADPTARPSVGSVHATLMGVRSPKVTTTAHAPLPIRAPTIPRRTTRSAGPGTPPTPSTPAGAVPPVRTPTAASSRSRPAGAGAALRGKGLRLAGDPSGRPPDTPATPAAGRSDAPSLKGRLSRGGALLGKLLGKIEEKRPR